MNWLKISLVAFSLGIIVAGCAPSPTSPSLGQSFTLKVGQSVSIAAEGLNLRFDAVVSDSRCPSDVQCIRAGEAEVRLIASQAGANTQLKLIERGLTSDLNVVDYKNYTIEFKLTPYPVSTQPIKVSDYRLELTVTKS
jgi:hypothetical protein